MKNLIYKKVVLAAVMLLLFVGCTKKQNHPLDLLKSNNETNDHLISTMPSEVVSNFYMLEFKTPALLEGVQNGAISPDRKKQLLAEQAEMEKKILDLSPDVKIIYKYRLLLNAFYVYAPTVKESELNSITSIARVTKAVIFSRPLVKMTEAKVDPSQLLDGPTSVDFIGSAIAHEKGFTGAGIRVGVIDTGIDYTHAMLGGSGDANIFKQMNPSEKSSLFPNKKVIGGIDLVGSDYNAGSPDVAANFPKPDDNPIDEGGHGSHVAGTIAGIGDQIHTYSGVAPDASLYAIKVFGKTGSTSDAVVISALEYAMDPNGDLDISDKLDVVNLSLGGDYGTPQILYNKAVRNASLANLTIVCAAGNAGHNQYIVSAPGTIDEALSVAASVDNMKHNYLFDALKVSTTLDAGQFDNKTVDYLEAAFSKKLSEIAQLKGKPVYIGIAQSLTDAQIAAVKGNIALIDRGVISFSQKVKAAQDAGAIAVVVVNNQEGEALAMGGEGTFDIPAVMIRKSIGEEIKANLALSKEIIIDFKSGLKVGKPEIIDTLTDFSSEGPRSLDSAIKPEIAAPGSQIISAAMGSGSMGVRFSGTSMATPHMAGVVAVLKQKMKNLTSVDVKSILMGTSKIIADKDKKTYPISLQGAGRVQLDKALDATVATNPSSLSLGELQIGQSIVLRKTLELKNLTNAAMNLKISSNLQKGFVVKDQNIVLKANSTQTINIDVKVNGDFVTEAVGELDGWIQVLKNGEVIQQIPMMAIVVKTSEVQVKELQILADSENVAEGAVAKLTVENQSQANKGVALPFILLGQSDRVKATNPQQLHQTMVCDLESVGYKIVDKDVNGQMKKVLQIAVKTYSPLTTWNFCEPNVQIDADEDNLPEQELAGIYSQNIAGMGGQPFFASVLFDAHKLKDLRLEYEKNMISDDPSVKEHAHEDYSSAIIAALPVLQYSHSTLTVLQVDLSQLTRTMKKTLRLKVGIQNYASDSMQNFDFLNKWIELDVEKGLSFIGLPELIEVNPHQKTTVEFTKGAAHEPLVVYYPLNAFSNANTGNDEQSTIIKKARFGGN